MLGASTWRWLAAAGCAVHSVSAALPQVDMNDNDSIKAAAKVIAEDLLSTFYPIDTIPNWNPGILPGPPPDGDYYWWQGGAMWGTLLDYRDRTGDKQFDAKITQAMIHQSGENRDYNPRNWSSSMGNDDQAFWGMSALIAAETGYTNPPDDQPQWLALAQALVHQQQDMKRRIPESDKTKCAWGLRWQVHQWAGDGFNYINVISNGAFMNMAARVGRYTGNQTYIEHAERTYTLLQDIGLIGSDYKVYDGVAWPACDAVSGLTYSYNAALIVQSCAYLYDATSDPTAKAKWKTEIGKLLDANLPWFFPEDHAGAALEPNCELQDKCNTDMASFKGYLHRWLATVMKLVPDTEATIMPVLKKSAALAVKQCTGGANGRMCGYFWSTGQYRLAIQGKSGQGAGEQMNVLGALLSVLPPGSYQSPLTGSTGGSSSGDPNAGLDSNNDDAFKHLKPITEGDKAGAGILTVLLIGLFFGGMGWLNWDQLRGGIGTL